MVCPAHVATGGTEALHETVSELNKQRNVHARLWYWSIHGGDPVPDAFRGYGCGYVAELPKGYDGVVVVPEIWANEVLRFEGCKKAVYWLGVDAYASWTPPEKHGEFLKDDTILHIAQSEYARDFLEKLGVRRVMKLVDVLNADFYEEYEEAPRGDVVLYNPAKMTPFMHSLMKACSGVTFKPIQGMTREEVISTMRSSKLYLDFGAFPGRERIPREAVMCGCCIITSRIGSAGFFEDFPHSDKFESKTGHIWAIRRRIQYVLEHYDECRRDFGFFRASLIEDHRRLRRQCREIAEALDEV